MVGAGQTVVIIDSYGSPTIAADLATFDLGFGLPDPPSFSVLAPLGTVPWNPSRYPDQLGWAAETTLDVEWAHTLAAGEGVQGLPEFLELEKYALDHRLGKIISQSWRKSLPGSWIIPPLIVGCTHLENFTFPTNGQRFAVTVPAQMLVLGEVISLQSALPA